jgi:hypothetical protein
VALAQGIRQRTRRLVYLRASHGHALCHGGLVEAAQRPQVKTHALIGKPTD